jgi:hypothetical protein
MTISSLYPTPTIICKVPQPSSEFQIQIQPQRGGRFSNATQRREPIGRWVNITDIEYTFECGINYTLDGVSIHPVITKTQETTQVFHYEANGDFKTVRVVLFVSFDFYLTRQVS